MTPLVSLLIVSKRPGFLPVILDMVARQTYRRFEIIIILHGVSTARLDPAARDALATAAVVEEAPAEWSLGRCLNEAIRHATGDLLAKIDDDDLYGQAYLAEAVAAWEAGLADIIGKTEAYYYFAQTREVHIRFPGKGLRPTRHLRGQSLLFPRRFGENPGFRDVSVSEDRLFVTDCLAGGARCYATSRRNLMVRRFGFDAGHAHTWMRDDAAIMAETLLVRGGITDDSPPALLRLIGG